MAQYIDAPKELKVTADEFVRRGEAECGEDIFAIEEAAEYIQSICKVKRYLHDYRLTGYAQDDLAMEMAHVYLTLNHMRVLYNVPLEKIQKYMDGKIEKYGLEVYRDGKE